MQPIIHAEMSASFNNGQSAPAAPMFPKLLFPLSTGSNMVCLPFSLPRHPELLRVVRIDFSLCDHLVEGCRGKSTRTCPSPLHSYEETKQGHGNLSLCLTPVAPGRAIIRYHRVMKISLAAVASRSLHHRE